MNARRILVADDEEPIQRMLARVLGRPAYEVVAAGDGRTALALAGAQAPDLILLDVHMPGMDGWEVLGELRRRPATRLTPVIMLTSARETSDKVGGLALGADDYVTKPFVQAELVARVDGLLRRHRQSLSANPLTGLPGSPAIEEEVSRRIAEKTPFAFFYADIDRFKSYNDAYGFAAGDQVLLQTAHILRESLVGGFLGHIGGDDFAAIGGLAEAPYAAQRLVSLFDERAPGFYAPEDRARGWLEGRDRLGRPRRSALVTLSVGIVTSERRDLACYARVAEIAAEMKSHLKSESGRTLSRFAFDRRRGP